MGRALVVGVLVTLIACPLTFLIVRALNNALWAAGLRQREIFYLGVVPLVLVPLVLGVGAALYARRMQSR
jgi:hypothetical protein